MSQKLKYGVGFIKAQPFLFIRFLRTNEQEMINISHEWWPPEKKKFRHKDKYVISSTSSHCSSYSFCSPSCPSFFFSLRIHLLHFFSKFIHSQYFSYASIYFGSRWIFVFFLLLILELFSLTFLLHFMHSSCTHGHRKNKKLIKVSKSYMEYTLESLR